MIYFDNSATSYPKPYYHKKIISDIYSNYSFNIGRGGYKPSVKAADKVFEVRELIGEMFSFQPQNVAFTNNCTEALNYAIKGLAEKGDHFLISSLEHNSVFRAVNKLSSEDVISFDTVPYYKDVNKQINAFKSYLKRNTKAVICSCASNVFGVRMPINEIGKLCRDKGIKFVVDAAQGAGVFDINGVRDNIDILCSAGHKALYGVMGTGFIAIKDNLELKTIIEGGTGSKSLDVNQPFNMPDRFEAGTLNVPGIILLGKGLKFIREVGIDNIYSQELKLIKRLYEILKDNNCKLYTDYPKDGETAPIVSFNYKDYSSEKTASYLSDKGIYTRGGYHCAPLAHSEFSTLDRGTVRISTGYFNTEKDCDKFAKEIKKL